MIFVVCFKNKNSNVKAKKTIADYVMSSKNFCLEYFAGKFIFLENYMQNHLRFRAGTALRCFVFCKKEAMRRSSNPEN